MIRLGDSWVCATCKPLFVQRLKEGIPCLRSSFRDLSRLTRRLKVFLIANVVALSLALWSDFLECVIPRGTSFPILNIKRSLL